MVHFPGFASAPYGFRCGLPGFTWLGFPIRKSPGQSLFNGSPKLFAAGHVLRRLPAPRHPPYALKNLTIKFSQDKKCRYSRLSKNRIFMPTPPPGAWEKRVVLVDGGADRNRTGDLRRAKPALSQLSYSPGPMRSARPPPRSKLVGLSGFEPLTSRLSGVRSYQLSYRPIRALFRGCVSTGPTPTSRRKKEQKRSDRTSRKLHL